MWAAQGGKRFYYFIGIINIYNHLSIRHHRLSRGRLNIVCPLPSLERIGVWTYCSDGAGGEKERYEEEMNTTSLGSSSVQFASNPFVKAEAGPFCNVDRCGHITFMWVEKDAGMCNKW